ncbi:MAG: PfkB family carbohydrate kinase [Pyrinomonadaceae bacterium]
MRFPFQLVSDKSFDAVGFGLNAVDHLIVVPSYPAFDTKTRLRQHLQAAGGQTASALAALRRLGMKTSYAGRFGSDAEGHFGYASMQAEDVDLEFAEMIEGSRTQIAFILIDERNGERTVIWDRDDKLAYPPEEAPIKLARLGRVLHLDAHDPPACSLMSRAAHEAGAIVSLDVDNVYEGLPDLLPLIDVLISSSEFPTRLTGIADRMTAVHEIKQRYGCPVTGMTLGEQGAFVMCEGREFTSPAFAVPGGCKDTTGAGDAFHAGFIFGMLRGEEIEGAMRYANAVAALKCRSLGARTALPTEPELQDFLSGS